jgi:hypothetical protein
MKSLLLDRSKAHSAVVDKKAVDAQRQAEAATLRPRKAAA